MRKLSWGCSHAQLHHGLCVVALTEAGVSKKEVNAAGFTRYPEIDLGREKLATGAYSVKLDDGAKLMDITTTEGTCKVNWTFSYPELKLTSFAITHCECDSSRLAEHDL